MRDRAVCPTFTLPLALFALVLVGSMAREGRAQGPAPEVCVPGATTQRRITLRPAISAFQNFRSKQVYPSSYAGAQYPPVFRRNPLTETQATVRRPFGSRFGWFGLSH